MMTQVVRQKRVLLLTSVNVVLAATAIAVVAIGLANANRGAREAVAQREGELRDELESLRAVRAELATLHDVRPELAGLRAELHGSIDELRRTQQAPPAVDSQLTQTLQLVASEQQLLLLRSLKSTAPERPKRVTERSARSARSARSSRRPHRSPRQAGCAVTK